jgi:hypothetical protein
MFRVVGALGRREFSAVVLRSWPKLQVDVSLITHKGVPVEVCQGRNKTVLWIMHFVQGTDPVSKLLCEGQK